MTAVVVREAAVADAAAVTAVHLSSRAAAMPWLPVLHTDGETARWVREVVFPTSRVWVAEDEGAVVGYAALDGDVLDGLYLLPEVRRRGIGTLLLDTVRAASPSGLTLHVFARNAAAIAFYAHHGFEMVATGDGSDNEEGLPDLTCRWTPVRRGGTEGCDADRAAPGWSWSIRVTPPACRALGSTTTADRARRSRSGRPRRRDRGRLRTTTPHRWATPASSRP